MSFGSPSAPAAKANFFMLERFDAVPEGRSRPEALTLEKGEVAAVVAVIMVDPALAATLYLVARARLGEQVDRLKEHLRTKAALRDGVILLGGEKPLHLIAPDRDAVLDCPEQSVQERLSPPPPRDAAP